MSECKGFPQYLKAIRVNTFMSGVFAMLSKKITTYLKDCKDPRSIFLFQEFLQKTLEKESDLDEMGREEVVAQMVHLYTVFLRQTVPLSPTVPIIPSPASSRSSESSEGAETFAKSVRAEAKVDQFRRTSYRILDMRRQNRG
jgi:hypothetical protein